MKKKKNYDQLEKTLPFKTLDGMTRVNVLNKLPADRYVVALKRLRTIVEKQDLNGYDSRCIGNANNECSWGLCQQNKNLWPDPQDYVWPHDSDRIQPLDGGACPLDWRDDPEESGCFHTCWFFQGKKPTREDVLNRIEELVDRERL